MVQHKGAISADLLKKLLSAGSAPVLVILIVLSQYVFQLDFTCPCSPSAGSKVITAMYLVLPWFTLFIIAFLTDRQLKKAFGCCCSECSSNRPWKHIFKVLTISSMWIITAMLDGDWFICVKTMNGNNTDISCKKNRTKQESLVINHMKSESQVRKTDCN